MSSTSTSLSRKCPLCDIHRHSHNSGNENCSICNVCYMSDLRHYCSICESKKFDDINDNLLEKGIKESLLTEEKKIQTACRLPLDDDAELENAIRQSVLDEAARKDAVNAKKAQEESDSKLAQNMARLDPQTTHPVRSQASRQAISQASLHVSSQTTRPASSQAPPKRLSTRGMFDRATHRRVSGNGACFFTSIWYLLYGSSGMTSRDGVLQISTEQLLCLKQEVLDYLRGLELSNNQFKLDELARFLQSVGLKKTISEYARDLMRSGYYGGSPELSILMKCHDQQVGIALVNMDQIASELSPVFHSPNRSGPNYRLGVLLFSGAHYELLLNPNSPKGTFDVTHSYVMNELKSDVPELRRIATCLKRGGK